MCAAIFDAVIMGVRVGVVSKYFGVPQPTVSNIVKRVQIRREGYMPRLRGRPNKLTLCDVKRLEVTLANHRFLPLHTIVAIFNANGHITISERRLRRYIRLIVFNNRAGAREPFI